MRGLMQHWPLVVPTILDHAKREHGDREIVTRPVESGMRRYTYRELHSRARRVAKMLQAYGVKAGDRIATLAWNTDRHVEIWYGVMGSGAICHTINPRLFADQIAYIINDAQDRMIFAEAAFVPLLQKLRAQLRSIERIVVLDAHQGPRDGSPELTGYEEWLATVDDGFEWVRMPEESAATLCYTSGTSGQPKGVLYSHRSNVLHALVVNQPDGFAIRACDVVLPVVPMFHANAWGLIYAAPMAGAKLVLPGPRLDGASVWELLDVERVTITAAVPTVWLSLLQYLDASGRKLPHLQRVLIGGSAVPRLIIERFERDFGVEVIHAWGMTEMSPVGSFGAPKTLDRDGDPEAYIRRKLKQGRAPYTVEMKLVNDAGEEMPRDGHAHGELMVRGPAVIAQYFGQQEPCTNCDGWFATGDVATIDASGYMQIVDRSKDVIKSGGEWISSIELENAAVGHADVAEAAVIGIPDEKWGERPLLLIVAKAGACPDPRSVLAYLSDKVPKWWLPDRVEVIQEIPHTATGKIRKDALREAFKRHPNP